jgi:hypothetical protein
MLNQRALPGNNDALFGASHKLAGSSSLLVIQGHYSTMATSKSRVTHSKIQINPWRNRASSHDQPGHQLAFTKSDDEPGGLDSVG